jgi:hypothetical protein
MNIEQEHVKFAKLLNQILIIEKRYTVESIARRTSTPAPTIREYCEGTLAVPVEFQALIYNATGDIDFLNFTIGDTDKVLIDRHRGKGEKSITEETLDVATAFGHLAESVQKAQKKTPEGGEKISYSESLVINKHINMIIKEAEDVRTRVEKMAEKVNIITINNNT